MAVLCARGDVIKTIEQLFLSSDPLVVDFDWRPHPGAKRAEKLVEPRTSSTRKPACQRLDDVDVAEPDLLIHCSEQLQQCQQFRLAVRFAVND
jgi:hypothetical protein